MEITPLRIFLFLGLLSHKFLWEILKRRSGNPHVSHAAPPSIGKRIVKLGKLGVFLFLCVQALFLDIFPISSDPLLVQSIGVLLFLSGLAMAVLGRLQLGKNWVDLEDYQVGSDQELVTRGIYHYVRHPIYGGDLILVLGLELALNSWLFLGAVVLALVIFHQARQEESLLIQSFPDYEKYRRQSKRFIPFVI